MRLIDADALKDEVMKIWAYIQCITGDDVMDAVMTDIKNAPTVDAVQVVRCKDCEYYVETNGGIGTCELTISGAKDDGFCAWGERKNDAAD